MQNAMSAKEQEIALHKDQIRKLQDQLAENTSLHNVMGDEIEKLKQNPLGTSDTDSVRAERDRLLEEKAGGKAPASGDKGGDASAVKYLRSKLYHFEKTVERLERERSGLQVRATMAEEQLRVLQQHL